MRLRRSWRLRSIPDCYDVVMSGWQTGALTAVRTTSSFRSYSVTFKHHLGRVRASSDVVKSHCHTDARVCFFSLRVVNHGNSLSQEIVDAPSVNAFKRHLESLRQKKRWVTSWSPHKPFWLLVMQDTIVICLRCMMTAIGAATPGELPGE